LFLEDKNTSWWRFDEEVGGVGIWFPRMFWQVPVFFLIFISKAYLLILRNFICKGTKFAALMLSSSERMEATHHRQERVGTFEVALL